MKNDIKKKFIDILFEPDDDEEEIVEKKETAKPVKKQESTVNARDILYRKPEKSAFINLEEKKEKKQDIGVETVYGDYEFSSQISPIFGVIKENKPNFVPNTSVNESLVSKPDNSHLEIITSPIYGYGSREDYSKDHFDINEVLADTDEEELHRLLDEDYGYDAHTYDDIDDDDEELDLFSLFNEDE
ncbi:MAG: hypothetical protein IKS54_05360 [Erysipelotrichaceae bacterium]|nr:hypothetical protein [Erysipelotrichaceae bacterium]